VSCSCTCDYKIVSLISTGRVCFANQLWNLGAKMLLILNSLFSSLAYIRQQCMYEADLGWEVAHTSACRAAICSNHFEQSIFITGIHTTAVHVWSRSRVRSGTYLSMQSCYLFCPVTRVSFSIWRTSHRQLHWVHLFTQSLLYLRLLTTYSFNITY